jgi:hypothetical protein
MASSYSDLGLELMVTGENAGTWGDKTNSNLNLIQQSVAGYEAVALTNSCYDRRNFVKCKKHGY